LLGQGGTRRHCTVDTAAGARGAAVCPGRAHKPCPVGQQGGCPVWHPPPPHLGGCLSGPPPSR